ncbi:hypothetical protein BD324DRAFT_118880 [Kockovaella imperatae]|uniref:Uncharacterized protein n=1 Tax=Kockovaella imperatae TaxID=4999 RepID=A0A1Y1UAQ4_9TREE|nr:hypothetical protein BD324DRAFT_118880 [Kockovaella imperatae]ORX35118.1 hypothetical protein BD324DRAFT_118880 [Kockovaella imperatae]
MDTMLKLIWCALLFFSGQTVVSAERTRIRSIDISHRRAHSLDKRGQVTVWNAGGPTIQDVTSSSVSDPAIKAILIAMVSCNPNWIVDLLGQQANGNGSSAPAAYTADEISYSIFDDTFYRRQFKTSPTGQGAQWPAGYANVVRDAQAQLANTSNSVFPHDVGMKIRMITGYPPRWFMPTLISATTDSLWHMVQRSSETPMLAQKSDRNPGSIYAITRPVQSSMT